MDLSVVVVSYNTADLLRQCLNSVFEETKGIDLEVIVVDNASCDGSQAMVQREFPEVKLIENSDNKGFAGANNQGLAVAGGRYFCLLNSDVVIQKEALSEMWAFLEREPKVGVVGPQLVFPDGSWQMGAAGFNLSLKTAFNQYFFLSRLSSRIRGCRGVYLLPGQVRGFATPVDWVSGACLMVRTEAVEQAGPLDESSFMYAEDLEWCERIKASGWEICYLDGLQVLHQRGASTREANGVSTLWLRGVDAYFKRRYGSRQAAILHLVEACGFSLRLIGYKGWGYLGGGWRYHRRAEEMKAYLRASLSLFKAAVAD